MLLRISVAALWLIVPRLAATASPVPAPADVWPVQVVAADSATLPGQLAKIDAAAKALPPDLGPAERYQKVFLSILAGAPETAWSDEMTRLASAPGSDGMTFALRDLGKAWVARLEMARISEALRGFYRHEIRFPESLSLVEADIPEAIRRDPWGEPWVYQVQAPEQFTSLNGQAYRLGPTRYPKLTLLRDALGNRKAAVPAWKITTVNAGGNPTLQFRSAASTALIQPGGMADGCFLLYIGQNWAVMAQVDQLFTVSFQQTFFMAGISDFLRPEAMRKLDTFVLRSRHVVEGSRAGQHRSPMKGASIEFADYRQYVKGDNLRTLDQKVFGRTERYYIKQFEEETNLRVNVIIDASGSMGYGSGNGPTKYQYACHITPAVRWPKRQLAAGKQP